jgi:hypothetical protein
MAEYFKGTLLASPIVRGSSGDTYGTHHSILGVGGYMEVKTLVERNAIPVDTVNGIGFDGISSGQRRLGMLVHVLEDNTTYHLHPKLSGSYYTLVQWNALTSGQKIALLSDNLQWYSDTSDIAEGDHISKTYTQNVHGFQIGNVLGFDGNEFIKVNSISAAIVEPLGIVTASDWLSTNQNFTITYAGFIDTTNILDVNGNGISGGTLYYLSSTDGKVTSIEPTNLNEVSKPILVGSSGSTGVVLQYRGIVKENLGVTYQEFSAYTGTTLAYLNKTVTGGTNIGFFSGYTGIQELAIATTNSSYSGSYLSEYNYYYRDDAGKIQIGTYQENGSLRRGYVKSSLPVKSWVYNQYIGSGNKVGWILVDGDITTNVGNFLTGFQYTGTVYTETEWSNVGGAGSDGYYNNGGNLTVDVSGSLTTGTTYNVDGPVYSDKLYRNLRFRTIKTNSPETLKVTFDKNFIYISGATAGAISGITGAANIGSGVAVYSGETAKVLQFKSIIGSGNTTVSDSGDTIVIYSEGNITGGINGLTTIGKNITLGGNLTGDTEINGVGSYDLNISDISEFKVQTSGATPNILRINNNEIFASYSGITVGLSDNGGLKYGANYALNYTNRSLVDKEYVDMVAIGLDPKLSANVATTVDIVLSGLTTIDGYLISNGDRILVKNQTDGTTNGIYIATGTTWNRSEDFNFSPSGETAQGALIPVISGDTQHNTLLVLVTPNPIISGVTSLTFGLFNSSVFDEGVGITIAGNVISVNGSALAGNSISWSGNTFNVDITSGTLATALSNKLDLNIYSTYTGITQPILDGALTGVTNLGGGSTIFKDISGRTINLKTISGGTNITITGNAEHIIINTSGGTEGTYDLASPSTIAVGGIPLGTTLTGYTAFQLFEKLLVPELYPTLTAPSFATSLSASTTLYEIGCNIAALNVIGTFNRGCINPQYCSTSNKRTGLINSYVYTGTQIAGTYATTACTITKQVTGYTTLIGTQTWGVVANYDAGVQPKGSNGTNYSTACGAGSLSSTSSIIGAYPLFGTTVSITGLTKQTLCNMSTANNVQINLVPETGGNKQKFEISCAWLGTPTNRPLTGILTFNSVANAWCYEGGTASCSLAAWEGSSSTETIQSNVVNYFTYTYNGVDRGGVCIRLVF